MSETHTTAEGPRLVAGRACGSCMMCCKVPHIEEFNKPAGVWCEHAVRGKGCGIYADRPGACRAFYCSWMQDASLGPEWKPDRAKFVVYVQRNGINLQVAVDPGLPNSWMKAPYYAQIKKWARDAAEHGGFVFVRNRSAHDRRAAGPRCRHWTGRPGRRDRRLTQTGCGGICVRCRGKKAVDASALAIVEGHSRLALRAKVIPALTRQYVPA